MVKDDNMLTLEQITKKGVWFGFPQREGSLS